MRSPVTMHSRPHHRRERTRAVWHCGSLAGASALGSSRDRSISVGRALQGAAMPSMRSRRTMILLAVWFFSSTHWPGSSWAPTRGARAPTVAMSPTSSRASSKRRPRPDASRRASWRAFASSSRRGAVNVDPRPPPTTQTTQTTHKAQRCATMTKPGRQRSYFSSASDPVPHHAVLPCPPAHGTPGARHARVGADHLRRDRRRRCRARHRTGVGRRAAGPARHHDRRRRSGGRRRRDPDRSEDRLVREQQGGQKQTTRDQAYTR